MLTCTYPLILWALLVIPVFWIVRRYLPFNPRIVSPRAAVSTYVKTTLFTPRTIWNFLRSCALASLIAASARVAWVGNPVIKQDSGVAIMMVLDMSGSMELFDDLQDTTSRFSRVKDSAQEFISNRPHDLIGLVLCGATAVSRCPLTFDKTALCSIIENLSLGDINPDGTALSTSIALGARRLAHSNASSKIMIVITDGSPTPGDLDPTVVIPYIMKEGITVYTIGVGSERGGYAHHPTMGIVQVQTALNSDLLQQYAYKTGGEYYRVSEPNGLRSVYKAIDEREKSNFQAPTFRFHYDLTRFFCMIALICLLIELCASWWWRRLV